MSTLLRIQARQIKYRTVLYKYEKGIRLEYDDRIAIDIGCG